MIETCIQIINLVLYIALAALLFYGIYALHLSVKALRLYIAKEENARKD